VLFGVRFASAWDCSALSGALNDGKRVQFHDGSLTLYRFGYFQIAALWFRRRVLEQSQIASIAKYREQCRAASDAYSSWLDVLMPMNWVTQGGGVVLSLLASATIFTDKLLFGADYHVFAGIVALIAAILSGLHHVLKCEPHQAECRKLVNSFDVLEAKFQALESRSDKGVPKALAALQAEYEQILRSRTATIPRWFERKANPEAVK